MTTADARPGHTIPPLIRRNTVLLALSQSFTGAGMQFAYGLGPLMVVQLTGSPALAGMALALIGASRFLIAYPIGQITDKFGRRPGIMMGLVLALIGAVVTGLSMWLESVAVWTVGLLLFAMGMSAAQQLRVAATDMYLPNRRAEALGYVSLGSLAGLLLSPLIVHVSEGVAKSWNIDPLGLPWLMVPVLILPGMLMVQFVRPDPKEIGMNLAHYYPGYQPPPRAQGADVDFSWRDMMANPRVRLALVANAAAQGNMAVVMVLTSLVLHHHGHSLTEIAQSHVFHTVGMFGFTIPLGRLAGRYGNTKVMFPGVIVALFGAVLVAFTGDYWFVTLGTFLVGVGWAAANVAATAEIADGFETHHRGRAIGVNETISGGINLIAAVTTGPILALGGLPATGIAAVLFALPPLVMVLPRLLRARAA